MIQGVFKVKLVSQSVLWVTVDVSGFFPRQNCCLRVFTGLKLMSDGVFWDKTDVSGLLWVKMDVPGEW